MIRIALMVLATTIAGCGPSAPAPATLRPDLASAALSIQHAVLVYEQDHGGGGESQVFVVGPCTNCGGDGVVGDTRVAIKCGICGGDGHIDEHDLGQAGEKGYATLMPSVIAPPEPHDDRPMESRLSRYRSLREGEQPCWRSDLVAAKGAAASLGRPCLIHFTLKDGCLPCEQWWVNCRNDPRVVVLVNDRLVACEVFIDPSNDSHLRLAKNYGVSEYPTQVLVSPDWQRLLARFPAAVEPDAYLKQLETAMNDDTQESGQESQESGQAPEASQTIKDQPAPETTGGNAGETEVATSTAEPQAASNARPGAGAVINAEIVNAGILNARRVVVSGRGGRATIAGYDHGVRIDLESEENEANVMLYLDSREGGVISLRHDDEQGPHVFALHLPNSEQQTDPMLQVSDVRDRSKCLRFNLMELAEYMRSQARTCDVVDA